MYCNRELMLEGYYTILDTSEGASLGRRKWSLVVFANKQIQNNIVDDTKIIVLVSRISLYNSKTSWYTDT